jgi:hypothetical protein
MPPAKHPDLMDAVCREILKLFKERGSLPLERIASHKPLQYYRTRIMYNRLRYLEYVGVVGVEEGTFSNGIPRKYYYAVPLSEVLQRACR